VRKVNLHSGTTTPPHTYRKQQDDDDDDARMVSFTVYKGAKDGKVYKSQTEKGDLKGDQVLLKVTASGLCGTDLHFRKADMGLGHEGVGVVQETGPGVTHLKKGDRVGWGYQ
jgi:D-arabinose 1-dehydrogenase-like Zn-dependent alcohol dehydrogenase